MRYIRIFGNCEMKRLDCTFDNRNLFKDNRLALMTSLFAPFEAGKRELLVDLRHQAVESGLILRFGAGDQNILRI